MNPVMDGEQSEYELSSVERFPAIRMLRDRARGQTLSKKRIKRLHQQLHQEQTNRFDHLVHAEWKGRNFGQFEHLQGRINHLCYHFIFAMEHGQPSEDVDGFLLVYESSTQELSELVVLLSFPKKDINKYGVLVRLTYMVGYVRTALQTESTIGLMEMVEYNERVDRVFDQLETRMRACEHTLNIAMDMSVEMCVHAIHTFYSHLLFPPSIHASSSQLPRVAGTGWCATCARSTPRRSDPSASRRTPRVATREATSWREPRAGASRW